MSDKCVRPGCTGTYLPDGYCDECGRKAPATAAPPAATAPNTGPGTAGASSTSSGRTSGRSRGSTRGRLGRGIVDMPHVPARDPATAILADPQVPESRRFCAECKQPVGRSRDGQPGRTEGFCPRDRTPYSFVPSLSPGALVGGRYEVLGALAHGGLGWIYLARDKNVGDEVSERWVVLKGLIDKDDPDALVSAIAERRFLVEVDHPGIVKIHDFVSHPDPRTGLPVGYIVMEFVGGRSLKDIRGDKTRPGPLPLTQVLAYALEILPAFGYLHDRGLVYCDFKPDNAIHTEDRLKLVDLGAVRRLDNTVDAIWGTPGYQAPEVSTGHLPTVSSDIYTIGRTLAVLSMDLRLSSTHAERLPEPADVPLLAQQESYHRLLRRATHRDPDRRFASTAEMADQTLGVLRQVLAATGEAPPPAPSAHFTGERGAFGTELGQVDPDNAARGAVGTAFDGPAIAAALPVPQVDPTDPGAAALLVAASGDLDAILMAAATAPDDSTEVPLAVVRARIAHGDLDGADRELRALGAADPFDWRVDWYRGLAALAGARPADARTAFDAVYDALPGELAPQLALAVAAEWAGDTGAALERYARVWRTDRSFVSAAFGQARILLDSAGLAGSAGYPAPAGAGGSDPAQAVAVLDSVPASSSHHQTAQIAAARLRVAAGPAALAVADLVDAAGRVDRLRLDVERRAVLTVELLDAALAWLGNGGRGTSDRLLGHRLNARDVRFGLEGAYRALAKVAPDTEARIALVDRANQVRPRTWF